MCSKCDICHEHALGCSCARCEIDKAANRNLGCDPKGTRIKKFSLKPVESIQIPEKNYSLFEMIEMAKNSEYGAVWYSEKGPIQITKEGKLEPI